MLNQALEDLSVLVVEPNAADRQALAQCLALTGIGGNLLLALDATEAERLTTGTAFDLVFVGAGFGEADEKAMLRALRQSSAAALIALAAPAEPKVLLQYLKAGAHGILLLPPSEEAVLEVVETVLTAREGAPRGTAATGPGQPLSSVLLAVAQRLEQISARLEQAELAGRHTAVSSKAVKEAILAAVSASNERDEGEVERLIRMLFA